MQFISKPWLVYVFLKDFSTLNLKILFSSHLSTYTVKLDMCPTFFQDQRFLHFHRTIRRPFRRKLDKKSNFLELSRLNSGNFPIKNRRTRIFHKMFDMSNSSVPNVCRSCLCTHTWQRCQSMPVHVVLWSCETKHCVFFVFLNGLSRLFQSKSVSLVRQQRAATLPSA